MKLDLNEQTVVVTGGASGIGLACAREFAQEGAQVVIWDTSEESSKVAAALETEFQISASGMNVDVSRYEVVCDAVAATERLGGGICHVVHAAAIPSGKFGFPFTSLKPDDWRKVLDVNILGMVNVAHAVAPVMTERRFGSITMIGSVAGQIGSSTDPPYSASKAAMLNFAQCMAKDLAGSSIRVNVVNPGMVQTPLNRSVWMTWNERQPKELKLSYDEWASQKIRSVVPLGRWQTPEDIAAMVVFLASPRASQITGQAINVDGGQVMHW